MACSLPTSLAVLLVSFTSSSICSSIAAPSDSPDSNEAALPAAAAAAAVAGSISPPPTKPGYTLTWHDEFDGPSGAPPNASNWGVYDNKTHGDLEQQLYVSSAV